MRAVIEAARVTLEAEYRAAGKALKAVPGVGSGPSGLTPDAVKFSPPYREARARFDRALAALRAFNTQHRPHIR